jgi:hypothetical protein
MSFQSIRRITATTIDDVNRFIIDASEAFNRLIRDPILSRERITATLTTSSVTLAHNLGRPPTSILVVALNADARVWQSGASTASTITVQASAACTATLEVY